MVAVTNSIRFQRNFLIILLIAGILMIYFYRGPVSDFYTSLTIKELRIGLNEFDIHKPMGINEMDYMYLCLNELLSRRSTNLTGAPDMREVEEKNLSLCNEAASKRGPHQRVVSFNFFGRIDSERNYFNGIEENAKLMAKVYPKWIMRVYHDIPPFTLNASISESILNASDGATNSTVDMFQEFYQGLISSPQAKLCILQHLYPMLDLCYAGNISGYGNLLGSQSNMWRFLPMADLLVDVFLSRDLDSRISEREKAAVDEWLSSNLTFHIMRDSNYQPDEILAGLWGAVNYREREKLANLTKRMMDGGKKFINKDLDQLLLKNILWPEIKGNVMQHDSYYCKKYSSHGNVRPWPTQRLNTSYNFVGSRDRLDAKAKPPDCPSICRPKDKQYWLKC